MSCNVAITNASGNVTFNCPSCGKGEIIRCKHCRQIASKYSCPQCKFTGPN
jgi:predicted RNA-binding Zn-ribbon protein involved in translation (DUF1610 family)